MVYPDGGPFRVQRLDLEDGSEMASIGMAAFPDMAVATSTAVWVATLDEGRSALVRVDPATNKVLAERGPDARLGGPRHGRLRGGSSRAD